MFGFSKSSASSIIMTLDEAKAMLRDWEKESPDGTKISISYRQSNPKMAGKQAWMRYEKYKNASTINDALKNGTTIGDLAWDLSHGFLTREQLK